MVIFIIIAVISHEIQRLSVNNSLWMSAADTVRIVLHPLHDAFQNLLKMVMMFTSNSNHSVTSRDIVVQFPIPVVFPAGPIAGMGAIRTVCTATEAKPKKRVKREIDWDREERKEDGREESRNEGRERGREKDGRKEGREREREGWWKAEREERRKKRTVSQSSWFLLCSTFSVKPMHWFSCLVLKPWTKFTQIVFKCVSLGCGSESHQSNI